MISAHERRTERQSGFVNPPTLWVPQLTWQKLMTYVQLCPVEINGFGYIDPMPGGFMLSEVFILPQQVTAGSADVDAAVVARHMTDMIRRGEDTGRMRFQWHSHVNMPAYFSGTDLGNIEAYDSDWMISLVTNKRGEYSLQLDVFRPFRVWTPVQLHVVMPSEPAITAICQDDILHNVRRADGLLRRGPIKPAPTSSVRGSTLPAESTKVLHVVED